MYGRNPMKNDIRKRRSMNKKKRVVMKEGSTNVTYTKISKVLIMMIIMMMVMMMIMISKRRRRLLSDLYTTLLDASWSYCILIFASNFYFSWLLFALIYWLIAHSHGDLLQDGLCQGTSVLENNTHTCCVHAVDPYIADYFLFSLETQHTIGYGSRQTSTECPEAIFVMSLQVRTREFLVLIFYFFSWEPAH